MVIFVSRLAYEPICLRNYHAEVTVKQRLVINQALYSRTIMFNAIGDYLVLQSVNIN